MTTVRSYQFPLVFGIAFLVFGIVEILFFSFDYPKSWFRLIFGIMYIIVSIAQFYVSYQKRHKYERQKGNHND